MIYIARAPLSNAPFAAGSTARLRIFAVASVDPTVQFCGCASDNVPIPSRRIAHCILVNVSPFPRTFLRVVVRMRWMQFHFCYPTSRREIRPQPSSAYLCSPSPAAGLSSIRRIRTWSDALGCQSIREHDGFLREQSSNFGSALPTSSSQQENSLKSRSTWEYASKTLQPMPSKTNRSIGSKSPDAA
jgi:hypothetical protein